MQTSTAIELIGYAGSLLVLVSFLMTSVFKLRVVNTVGSVIFMIYALIIHSYPTALMNFCLVLINLHFLWKMSRVGKEYELVEVAPEDQFLRHSIARHADDIQKCFPGISLDTTQATRANLICCGDTPAGIFLTRENDENTEILLDYSTPAYRDFSLGKFLMEELKNAGVKKLIYRGSDENHKDYLEKTGFQKTASGYEKILQ